MKNLLFNGILGVALLLFSCESSEKGQESRGVEVPTTKNYLVIGDSLSAIAQDALLSRLSSVLRDKGGEGAVEYCNLKGIGLLDSLSKVHNVEIERVSERWRNPLDSPKTKDELFLLRQLDSLNKAGVQLTPRLVTTEGVLYYYKPIKIGMETCLNCHGGETRMEQATYAKIKQLYPSDRALGYELGDFRGLWKIRFNS